MSRVTEMPRHVGRIAEDFTSNLKNRLRNRWETLENVFPSANFSRIIDIIYLIDMIRKRIFRNNRNVVLPATRHVEA